MAIIIPSKNIYEINNPKIRDNLIDNVSIEQTVVKPNNEYETPVFNGIYDNLSYIDRETENVKTVGKVVYTGADIGASAVWIANSQITKQKTYLAQISINKLLKNKYINRVFYEKDKDENQIKYTVYGDIKEGTCYRSIGWDTPAFLQPEMDAIITNLGETTYNNDLALIEEDVSFDFSSKIYSSIKGTPKEEMFFEQEVSCDLTPLDVSFVSLYKDDTENDRFLINFEVMCKRTVVKTAGMDFNEAGLSGVVNCQGTYLEYEPKRIEITIYGNTIGIDLTDGSVTYGSGNKPFSLPRNELLQDGGKVGETLLTEHLAKNVLEQYKKGKETATLLCSISNYFDENGNLSINDKGFALINLPLSITFYQTSDGGEIEVSTDGIAYGYRFLVTVQYTTNDGFVGTYVFDFSPSVGTITKRFEGVTIQDAKIVQQKKFETMLFGLHDEVIPMIFGADGQDKPMSSYQDGTEKVFEVVGTNIIYDGAVWQELYLQEKVKSY